MLKYPYFSFGRTLSWEYPSNRHIMLFTLLAAAIGLVVGLDKNIFEGIIQAAHYGASVLFAWIFCRELDPDFSPSAMVAAVVALLGTILLGTSITFVVLGVSIVLVRIINRTTGIRYMPLDGVLLAGCAAYLATTPYWLVGVVIGLDFLLDNFLDKPNRESPIFAGLILVSVVIVAAYYDHFSDSVPTPEVADIILVLLSVGGLILVNYLTPMRFESEGDYNHKPLNRRRILVGRWLLLLVAILPLLWVGEVAFEKLFPIWATFFSFLPLSMVRKFAG